MTLLLEVIDMPARIKIRSIYSTALTKLLLDAGYYVVEPSAKIRERFNLEHNSEPCDLFIRDRDDLQGIEISGPPENLCQFLTFLQEQLLDAVLLESGPAREEEGLVRAGIEFPGGAKATLDAIRFSVTPTLLRHHRLRIINSRALEKAEILLTAHPEKKDSLEKNLFLETILLPIEKSGLVKMEHVRPSGKSMRPREGILIKSNSQGLIFKRFFSKGRYDGLDIPIQQGDYGLTEVHEGSWYVKHSYYTKEGKLIGEYFNINTPVELYPYGARYLDLEVDVIRRAGEKPSIIDREKLSLLTRQGQIGSTLEMKAMEIAESLAAEK
jgi:hypothetical protein